MATVYTNVGIAKVVDIIDGTATAPAWYIAWATGAGTATATSTTLFNEAAESRVIATLSQPTADKNQFVATMTAAGNKTITNAGIFDNTVGGNLLIHGDFSGVALLTDDQIKFTFTLQQT